MTKTTVAAALISLLFGVCVHADDTPAFAKPMPKQRTPANMADEVDPDAGGHRLCNTVHEDIEMGVDMVRELFAW